MGRRRRRLTYGDRQLLKERLDVLRRNPRTLVEVGAITVGVCLLELFVVPGHGEYSAFFAALVAASTGWALVLRLLVDTERATKGVAGEALTRELVDGVPQWLAVHELPLAGRIIDHVVITPLAVLAVETKWWGEASPAVHEQRRAAAMAQAEKNARTLKHLLASRDLGFELPVWPVVMTWGPGAEPTELGKVDVVAGEAPHAWIAAYQTGAIHARLAADAHAALQRLPGAVRPARPRPAAPGRRLTQGPRAYRRTNPCIGGLPAAVATLSVVRDATRPHGPASHTSSRRQTSTCTFPPGACRAGP